MRGATRSPRKSPAKLLISTHAPHAGSDETGQMKSSTSAIFQPTLPMRGATLASACTAASNAHFNPRSPCGERRIIRVCGEFARQFQPTLPMRGATIERQFNKLSQKFQPTLPMRGATATYCVAHYIFTRYSQIS